jgi:predicted aspartyl protease
MGFTGFTVLDEMTRDEMNRDEMTHDKLTRVEMGVMK